MIPSRDKNTDIRNEVNGGNRLKKNIDKWATEVATAHTVAREDVNDKIASIAERERLNRIQIQRLIEEANTVTYNKLYEALRNTNNRTIDFNLGNLEEVVNRMGDKAPPEITNPNFATGAPGSGVITKVASEEEKPDLHTPTKNWRKHQEAREKRAAKRKEREMEKQAKTRAREQEEGVFKIAQALVQSEHKHQNGNEIFNTMLSDVSLDNADIDGIQKKASYITERLRDGGRVRPSFVVTLTQDPQEKVASPLLGEYSLLKQAEANDRVKEVKVQPVQGISDYEGIIAEARKLQARRQQQQQQNQQAAQQSERSDS